MSRKRLFEHKLIQLPDLPAQMIGGKRYYTTPSGTLLKSVTTVIGEATDKTHLIKWKQRIGETEAQKITTQAAARGTALHKICENYVLNMDCYPPKAMPANIATFKSLRPLIDQHVGTIYGIETPLYSFTLRAAGRTDLCADWDFIPSVIDFKTSLKPKREEWIQNYFWQATAYTIMLEELTDLEFPQIVLLIAVDHDEPQVFVKNRDDYKAKVLEIFANQAV